MKRENEWGILSQIEKSLTDNRQNGVLRTAYEPPKTKLLKVETEGNFCGSVIDDDKESSDVTTSTHDVQTEFIDTNNKPIEKDPFDFSSGTWN